MLFPNSLAKKEPDTEEPCVGTPHTEPDHPSSTMPTSPVSRTSFELDDDSSNNEVTLVPRPISERRRDSWSRRGSWLVGLIALVGITFLGLDAKQSPSSSSTQEGYPSFAPEELQSLNSNTPETTTTTESETTTTRTTTRPNVANSPPVNGDESAMLEFYRQRLRPRKLVVNAAPINNTSPDGATPLVIPPHQFLHLHHMKTGGTSIDGLMRCGMERLQKAAKAAGSDPSMNGKSSKNSTKPPFFKYSNLHECSASHYQRCRDGTGGTECQDRIASASILSYCAPLQDIPIFDWEQAVSAVTVLRHPVDRVWSMFRFQTKSCFKCRELKDIYAELTGPHAGNTTLKDTCRLQLFNHQTRNVLRNAPDIPSTPEHAAEAIANLQSFFTLVGLTSDMTTTAAMVAHVFPWLAPELGPAWADTLQHAGDATTTTTTHPLWHTNHTTTTSCTLGHRNASPKNNHCAGDGKEHWDLPDHPDEETAALILQHNQLDLQLYEAGLEIFEWQKKALGLSKDSP